MSKNYLDNDTNSKNEFKNVDGKVVIRVDHGDHYHDLNISEVTIEDMYEKTNQVLGDAHRASKHYDKDKNK